MIRYSYLDELNLIKINRNPFDHNGLEKTTVNHKRRKLTMAARAWKIKISNRLRKLKSVAKLNFRAESRQRLDRRTSPRAAEKER